MKLNLLFELSIVSWKSNRASWVCDKIEVSSIQHDWHDDRFEISPRGGAPFVRRFSEMQVGECYNFLMTRTRGWLSRMEMCLGDGSKKLQHRDRIEILLPLLSMLSSIPCALPCPRYSLASQAAAAHSDTCLVQPHPKGSRPPEHMSPHDRYSIA